MPRANPETMTKPALPKSRANRSAILTPAAEALREPTIATWGRVSAAILPRTASIGGGQRPYFDLLTWMAPAGACYLPATVVPVGRLPDGMPVGIQIVGPYLEDLTTLDLGKRLLAMCGGCPRPPGF